MKALSPRFLVISSLVVSFVTPAVSSRLSAAVLAPAEDNFWNVVDYVSLL